jgi:hypothetical protein
MRDTRPTVFSLNVADGHVRGRPTAVLEAQPDEAYYADEFGVQISRPVRAEVASELGGSSSAYVEPDAAPAAPPPLNRHTRRTRSAPTPWPRCTAAPTATRARPPTRRPTPLASAVDAEHLHARPGAPHHARAHQHDRL